MGAERRLFQIHLKPVPATMPGTVAKVAKPLMRGMHVAQIKKNIAVAALFSTATTLGWYVYVVKARKDNYRDFYAVYDADKDYERMKAAGIFQSQAIIEEKGE